MSVSCSKTEYVPERVEMEVVELNVAAYACDNTGRSDCSAALSRALSDAAEYDGAVLYMPAGDYLLTRSVVAGIAAPCHLKIKGAGAGHTRILVRNTAGGISLDFSDENSSLEIEDLSFYADVPLAGTALYCRRSFSGRYTHRSFLSRNTEFRIPQSDIATDKCFSTGVMLRGAYNPRFENVVVAGPYGPNVSSGPDSPLYKANYGIVIKESYAPEFVDTYVWSQKEAFLLEENRDAGTLPVQFIRCNAVETLRGVSIYGNNSSPVVLDQCHINCKEVGIGLYGCGDVTICGSLLYNGDDPQANAWESYSDILTMDCTRIRIHDNIFHFNGNQNRTGVDIRTSNGVSVTGNKFTFTGRSIKTDGGSSGILSENNYFDTTALPPLL